ncbi:tRNA pseudouridine(55) synthase TruB [Candidatus Ichthyocystis hellenicum]|uniref:tRNA pseudouridine(55) synthase TruB n=1 Tax=Candidatus Ichthyocystis hellenicum TaxID=1561003 RepID=UPI000A7586A7|nr:tRNA pseudouridine(55) synthase TruB [Candidatus Ichthyocystis hellenicum]
MNMKCLSAPKNSRDSIDGVLLFNKPVGFTSNDAVQKIKRLFCAKKVGHTGTLDPLASGLMLICFGKSTKLFDELVSKQKSYVAQVILGENRDTGDREGEVKQVSYHQPSLVDVRRAVYSFLGPVQQIVPSYSAVKYNGLPLYGWVRRGIHVERPRRQIDIHGIILSGYSYPVIDIVVYCGKGTYIRTLAEDIGRNLGCCAYLGQLTRTMIGKHCILDAMHLEELEALSLEKRRGTLLPI